MRRLLFANIVRLKMNKVFWLMVCCMVVIELILGCLLATQSLSLDNLIFLSLPCIGLLSSIFFSLYLGTEYSDGTIRNKVIIGHHRNHIYLANFLTGAFGATLLCSAGIMSGGVIGIFFHATFAYDAVQILLAALIGWLASISYIAIFNLVGMLSTSKAKTSIICMLTAFLLVGIGAICFSILANEQNRISAFLYEFNPFGQTIQTLMVYIAEPWKFIGYAFMLTCLCNGIGCYFFGKKNLR